MRAVPGVVIGKVCDRTFLMHLGGKIEMTSKHPIRNRDDLSMIYTPGVARVCLAIAKNPEDARRLTIKRNSDRGGHRRLGRARARQHRPGGRAAGDGGQGGAVQAVRRHRRLAAVPGHPGHRRDRRPWSRRSPRASPASTWRTSPRRAASRSRRRLRELLDIPVFHDDQHGTAIVVLAALYNALRVVGQGHRRRPDRDVRRRRGRHGDHQAAAGGRAPRRGRGRHRRRRAPRPRRAWSASSRWLAENTNALGVTGSLQGGRRRGRRVHRRVRARTCSTATTWRRWPTGAIVFALANPEPEVDPAEATPSTPRSSRPGAPTSRTRSTTCWRSPGCSAACSTRGRRRSPDDAAGRGAGAGGGGHRRRAQRHLHHRRACSTPTCTTQSAAAVRRAAGGPAELRRRRHRSRGLSRRRPPAPAVGTAPAAYGAGRRPPSRRSSGSPSTSGACTGHRPAAVRVVPAARTRSSTCSASGCRCSSSCSPLQLHVAARGRLPGARTVALVVGLFALHAGVSELVQRALYTTRTRRPAPTRWPTGVGTLPGPGRLPFCFRRRTPTSAAAGPATREERAWTSVNRGPAICWWRASLLADGVFDQTVVLVLDSDEDGALGVILNEISQTTLDSVLPDWVPAVSEPRLLFHGGPVSPNGAICLASVSGAGRSRPAGARCSTTSACCTWTPRSRSSRARTPTCASSPATPVGRPGSSQARSRRDVARGQGGVRRRVRSRPHGAVARVLRRQRTPVAFFSTWVEDPATN